MNKSRIVLHTRIFLSFFGFVWALYNQDFDSKVKNVFIIFTKFNICISTFLFIHFIYTQLGICHTFLNLQWSGFITVYGRRVKQGLREDKEGEWRYPERQELTARQLWGGVEDGGVVVQYVADPWHTRQLHFPRCSLSWCWAPPVPLPPSQHRFVCPHNLPAKKATQVVPSQWRLTSPSIFYISCALTLCLFLSLYPGCLHPLPLQPTAWRHKETPPWQR